jgi:hypothetical protein
VRVGRSSAPDATQRGRSRRARGPAQAPTSAGSGPVAVGWPVVDAGDEQSGRPPTPLRGAVRWPLRALPATSRALPAQPVGMRATGLANRGVPARPGRWPRRRVDRAAPAGRRARVGSARRRRRLGDFRGMPAPCSSGSGSLMNRSVAVARTAHSTAAGSHAECAAGVDAFRPPYGVWPAAAGPADCSLTRLAMRGAEQAPAPVRAQWPRPRRPARFGRERR